MTNFEMFLMTEIMKAKKKIVKPYDSSDRLTEQERIINIEAQTELDIYRKILTKYINNEFEFS